jgi:hypothetical protein
MWCALITEMRFLPPDHGVINTESLVEEMPLIPNLDEVEV